jgi:hypothetical protein
MTGLSPIQGSLKVVFIGAIAAGAAFTIARAIEGELRNSYK